MTDYELLCEKLRQAELTRVAQAGRLNSALEEVCSLDDEVKVSRVIIEQLKIRIDKETAKANEWKRETFSANYLLGVRNGMIADLESQIGRRKAADTDRMDWVARCDVMLTEKEDLQQELARVESKLLKSGRNVMRLSKDVATLRSCRMTIDQLRSEAERKNTCIRQLRKRVEARKTENSLLNVELKSTRESRDRIGEAWDKLTKQKERSKRYSDEIRRQCETLDTRLDASLFREKEQSEHLASELATEQAKVRVLRRRLSVVVEGKACAYPDGDPIEMRGIIAERNNIIDVLRDEIEMERTENEKLKHGLEGVEDLFRRKARRVDSLRDSLRTVRAKYRTAVDAFNALHLESGATTVHPPLREANIRDRIRSSDGGTAHWVCVRCGRAFVSKAEAHDMDKHMPDCIWVELSEVRAITQQCVAETEE